MTKEQLAVLVNAVQTMQHALIFVQTKEKMYSVGVELYERALSDLWKLVEAAKADAAKPDSPCPIPEAKFEVIGPDQLSRLRAQVCDGPDGPGTALVFAGFSGPEEIGLFMSTLTNNGTFMPPRGTLQ